MTTPRTTYHRSRDPVCHKLARQARQAALHATPDDWDQITQTVGDAGAGRLAIPDATTRMRAILKAQHDRQTVLRLIQAVAAGQVKPADATATLLGEQDRAAA